MTPESDYPTSPAGLSGVRKRARIAAMRVAFLLPGVMLVAMLLGLVACEKPLFPKDAPRSPYDRYAALRGQQRQATQENEYGGEEPALRERLRPLDQP